MGTAHSNLSTPSSRAQVRLPDSPGVWVQVLGLGEPRSHRRVRAAAPSGRSRRPQAPLCALLRAEPCGTRGHTPWAGPLRRGGTGASPGGRGTELGQARSSCAEGSGGPGGASLTSTRVSGGNLGLSRVRGPSGGLTALRSSADRQGATGGARGLGGPAGGRSEVGVRGRRTGRSLTPWTELALWAEPPRVRAPRGQWVLQGGGSLLGSHHDLLQARVPPEVQAEAGRGPAGTTARGGHGPRGSARGGARVLRAVWVRVGVGVGVGVAGGRPRDLRGTPGESCSVPALSPPNAVPPPTPWPLTLDSHRVLHLQRSQGSVSGTGLPLLSGTLSGGRLTLGEPVSPWGAGPSPRLTTRLGGAGFLASVLTSWTGITAPGSGV